MSEDYARLQINDQEYRLPVLTGSDGQRVVSAQGFYENSGYYFYDPTLNNVAVTSSQITNIDQKSDHLYYRGYDIEALVQHSNFIEVTYLLSKGELPDQEQYEIYSRSLSSHSLVHESMRNFFNSFPGDAHPLAILATMVTALSSYYPMSYEEHKASGIDVTIRLLAKVRTLAAWSYKKSIGHPVIYPRDDLPYWTNFLNMMFSVPIEPYLIDPKDDRIMNQLMILYCDHEQNIATSTVRLLGSTHANLFVCINAGISALWGAREATYEVLTVPMIEYMLDHRMPAEQYFEKFIKGGEPLRSPAFGHAKYNRIDPRARLSRQLFHEYYKNYNGPFKNDPFMEKALEVEEYTSGHPFFKELKLYPSLDFYSALIFRMLGVPSNMYNAIRVIGKLSGWLAHWLEQRQDEESRSMRPQQLYTGAAPRKYSSLDSR